MSFLKRMLGREGPEALEARAEEAMKRGSFGEAKLTLERALERLPAEAAEARARLEIRKNAAQDGIARARIEEAARLAEQGAPELARAELAGALEVAVDPGLRTEAREALDALERDDAVGAASEVELSDDERRALFVAQWSEAQVDEFEPYRERLLDALLAAAEPHAEGEANPGRLAMEALLAEASEPCHLYREIAVARAADGDLDGAVAAVERYLEALPESATEESILAARHYLAGLEATRGDTEAALEQLWAGLEAAPDDVRAYKVLGATLRQAGRPEEAVEVLTNGLDVMGDTPDWQLLQELGLAHDDAGRPEKAKEWLERVVDWMKAQRLLDFPPPAATTLARIYEGEGRLDRAADLYRLLAMGSDRANHAAYHREAGRLLGALGLAGDARRMLKRAEALLEGDPDAQSTVRAELEALEA
jgi:tetratricopeptide (TPR) repeat protein